MTKLHRRPGTPTRRALIFSTVPVIIALLAIAGCGGDDNNSSTTTTSANTTATNTTPSGNVNNKGSANFEGKSSGEVELDDFYFKPTTIEGKPGQTVTLALKNEGSEEHNFSLSDQGIDEDLEPGKTANVKIKFPSSGETRFICKYHQSQGMAGTLETSGSGGGSSGSGSSGGSDDSSGGSSGGSSSSGSGGGGY